MKMFDIARRAGKNLKQAKLRTLFTSMAIAVGAFTIMMALAAGEGTRGYTNNLIQSNVDPQALFIVADESLFESGPTASTGLEEYDSNSTGVTAASGTSRDITPLTQEDVDKITNKDYIESIQPIYTLSAKYVMFAGKDAKYTATLSVYDPNVVPEVSAGSVPARGTDLKEGEVVVPASYTETLGMSEQDLVGKEIKVTIVKPSASLSTEELAALVASGNVSKITSTLSGKEETLKLKIAAVAGENQMSFTSGEAATMVSQADAKKIYDYTTEGTDSYEKYFGATAVVKDGTDPADAKAKLESDGYAVQTTKDLQALIFTIVNVLQWIVAGFGILALIASVFGIINTMYISVLERTSQIGLMRALGAPARSIAKLFRYEAAWIGFLGGVIGAGLAIILGLLLNPFITEKLKLGAGNDLLIFQPIPIVGLLALLIVIAIVAGWFPSRKAAKLDPIEALRTE